MPTYLVYDPDRNDLLIVSEKSGSATDNAVFSVAGYQLNVWYDPQHLQTIKTDVIPLLQIRSNPITKDVELLTDTLMQRYPGSGFISLGASPKLLKWRMRQKFAIIRTVNASKIEAGADPTPAFIEYLKGKLSVLPADKPIVVLDFADSGVSLYQIKRAIQSIRPDAAIKTVAVGHSEKLLKESNKAYKDDLDRIFNEEIPSLSSSLFKQATKNTLGRSKVRNPYATWSLNSRQADATQAKYRSAKARYLGAFAKGRFTLSESDLLGILETMEAENPAVVDDEEDAFA